MAAKGVFFKCAHSEGKGALSYTPDGRQIVTGGEDTLIKIFQAEDLDAEPRTIEHHEAPITALAIDRKGQHLATGTEEYLAEYFSYPSAEFERNLTRLQTAVRCVAFDHKGRNVGIGGDDGTIRIVNLTIKHFTTLKAHSDSILCIAFDPLGDYLATSSADGTVRIWDMRDDPHTIKTITVCARVPQGPAQQLRVAWHPKGESLALPKGTGVQVLARDTWEAESDLTGGHTREVTLLAWSANGRYICTGGMDRQHFLWDVTTSESLDRHKADNLSCDLMWSPKNNEIALLDDNGFLGLWRQPVPAHLTPPVGDPDAAPAKPAPAAAKQTGAPAAKDDAATAQGEADEADDDLIEPTVGESKGRRRLKKVMHDSDDGGFSDHDDDEAAEAAALAEQLKRHGVRGVADGADGMSLSAARAAAAALAATPAVAKAQESRSAAMHGVLHSSSTPEKNGRRFLLWNLTGMVLTRDENTYNAIEVDFNDAEAHRTMRLTDHYGFSMAALDDAAVMFASATNHGNPSTIVYRPLVSWAPNSDWQVQLDKGEDAVAVALGHKFAAVATTARYLRIYSHTGAPRALLCHAQPLVALAASEGLLALVQHAGRAVGADDQSLLLTVYDMREPSRPVRLSHGALPLSSQATLEWVGFGDKNQLATVDSAGVVRQCVRSAGYEWVPLLHTEGLKKSKAEHHWVVGLTSSQLMCVICKGENRFPATLPRPVLSALPLSMPVACSEPAEPQSESGRMLSLLQLDEFRLAASEAGVEDEAETRAQLLRAVQSLDSHTLRLFNAACKAERNARALDLAVQLHLPKTLAGALKLANHFKLGPLSDRITRLLEAKHDCVSIEDDLELAPAGRARPRAARTPSAAAPRAQREEAPPAEKQPQDQGVEEPQQEASEADDEEEETAPPPKPVLNPFAKAASQANRGGKTNLDVGTAAAKTPSTVDGKKRKAVTSGTASSKRFK